MAWTKKQEKVLQLILDAEQDEDEILAKNKVEREEYDIWIDSVEWKERFERHIRKNERRAQLLISNYQTVAAAKLVELTSCDKEQTARQACLDIIQMPRIARKQEIVPAIESLKITEKTANSIIDLLAKEAKNARIKEP